MGLSPNLLKVLSCPLTGGKLIYDRVNNELLSESVGLAYPIIDEIPILLVDKARKIHAITSVKQPNTGSIRKKAKNLTSGSL